MTEEGLQEKPKKEELMQMLTEMINSYDRLPQHALISPITHYDMLSLLLLLSGLFRSED